MLMRFPLLGMALAGFLWLGAGPAWAEVVRFRYAPMDTCGNTALVPGPNGAPGERSPWVGGPKEPFPRQPAPTHMVTFRHPAGNKNVIVPFTFPQGIPRIETRSDRIIYNWGSYQVQARFLPDGCVDVLYNSGVLRPISFQ
jgi:hypothetical protein